MKLPLGMDAHRGGPRSGCEMSCGRNCADGVRLTTKRGFYPVVGSTIQVLMAVSKVMGPRRGGVTHAAFTDWEVRWTYSCKVSPAGWTAGDLSVVVDATVTLPIWTPPRSASADVVRAWRRYVSALKVHEEGHTRLATLAGWAVDRSLRRLSPAPTPSQLEALAARIGEDVLDGFRELERDYDERTKHGATQGVAPPRRFTAKEGAW